MSKYVVKNKEIYSILDTVYQAFGVRLDFVYIYNYKLAAMASYDEKDVRISNYCNYLHESPEFLKNCELFDEKLIDEARKTGKIAIRKCPGKLLNGCAPFFDDDNTFLGVIIFGQIRPKGQKPPKGLSKQLKKFYLELPELDKEQMENLGKLLKFVGQSIVRQHMVFFKKLGWSEKVEHYIDAHIDEQITIAHLANFAGKSKSFISQNFRKEFGNSPTRYILEKKMEKAKLLFNEGYRVNQVAEKLGFYDAFHFSKCFKKHFGQSPHQLKSSHSK